MSKKYTVVFDELNLRGGGLYCFLPYENLDKHSKAIFKIGVAMNFRSRIEQYHTYFPNGVYMVAFLEEPPVPIKTRSKKNITKKELFIKIENFIMNYLAVNGAKRVYATNWPTEYILGHYYLPQDVTKATTTVPVELTLIVT